ncbi:hypothetical protein PGT21_030683 [Puccinia graminis f. sp. tritici]|uniref:Uncharacterized protein n=1 Tax=Puccinia graminis f. sp. tritici TaxID=56615 RepID=A0A5B0S0S8_PUCGR|nr:hypothetical protein PGT21_030683 [Puccinia graminis f. sp. tritici]KAA1131328.1 hypothetical protein PGTUg99_031632 [Puccinia graminis f. sp. tritici]
MILFSHLVRFFRSPFIFKSESPEFTDHPILACYGSFARQDGSSFSAARVHKQQQDPLQPTKIAGNRLGMSFRSTGGTLNAVSTGNLPISFSFQQHQPGDRNKPIDGWP